MQAAREGGTVIKLGNAKYYDVKNLKINILNLLTISYKNVPFKMRNMYMCLQEGTPDSLLLFLAAHAALLLLALLGAHLGGLLELLDELLLLDLRVEQVLPPLLIDLPLPKLPRFLFHPLLLQLSLLLQVLVFEADVFVVHKLAFTPLAETVFVVLALVAAEVVLDGADLLESKLVEAEFEVDQITVDLARHNPLLATPVIHLAVRQVQRE